MEGVVGASFPSEHFRLDNDGQARPRFGRESPVHYNGLLRTLHRITLSGERRIRIIKRFSGSAPPPVHGEFLFCPDNGSDSKSRLRLVNCCDEYKKYKRGSQPIPSPVLGEDCAGARRYVGPRDANPAYFARIGSYSPLLYRRAPASRGHLPSRSPARASSPRHQRKMRLNWWRWVKRFNPAQAAPAPAATAVRAPGALCTPGARGSP